MALSNVFYAVYNLDPSSLCEHVCTLIFSPQSWFSVNWFCPLHLHTAFAWKATDVNTTSFLPWVKLCVWSVFSAVKCCIDCSLFMCHIGLECFFYLVVNEWILLDNNGKKCCNLHQNLIALDMQCCYCTYSTRQESWPSRLKTIPPKTVSSCIAPTVS